MFIDDYSYLENNPGDENMNMRPMPYMTWGNSPMYNPYMPNMASSMDNINYNDMNRCNNNIANKNESNSGVQLELTTALRKQFFKHYKLDRHTRSDSDKYTKDFYKFANAVQKGIEKVN